MQQNCPCLLTLIQPITQLTQLVNIFNPRLKIGGVSKSRLIRPDWSKQKKLAQTTVSDGWSKIFIVQIIAIVGSLPEDLWICLPKLTSL